MNTALAAQAREAWLLADQLLEFFDGPLGLMIREEIGDGSTEAFDMNATEHQEALAFLTTTPAARAALVAVPTTRSAVLVLRARFLGLKIAKALHFAAHCEPERTRHSQNIVAFTGELLRLNPIEPTLSEILNAQRYPDLG